CVVPDDSMPRRTVAGNRLFGVDHVALVLCRQSVLRASYTGPVMTPSRAIAVLTAIPEEIAAFGTHLVETGRETVAGIEVRHGTLDGRKVVLAESGVGKVNGALAATVMLDRFDCQGILFSGVAGGLDPALSVGDLVIGTEIIQYDYG